MKTRYFLFAFFLIYPIEIFSQIYFERGYFIDIDNVKVDCYIKNEDWKNNPFSFDFKIDSLGEVLHNSLFDVKEFGFTNGTKFIKAAVDIDISSERIEKLSSDKKPIWQKDTVFLKVLIEGTGNLYYYEKEEIERFFFSSENVLF